MHIPEFGIKRENEERRDGGCAVVFDPMLQKYAVGKLPDGNFWLFSGGVEDGEKIEDGILREVAEESGLYDFLYVEKIDEAIAHYHNPLKNVNRVAHATCFLVILKTNNVKETKLEKHEKFTLVWLDAIEILENFKNREKETGGTGHWIYFFEKSVNRAIELGYDRMSNKFLKENNLKK